MKNKYTLGLVLACCMVLLACSKNEPQAPNTELTQNRLRTSSTSPLYSRHKNYVQASFIPIGLKIKL